MKFFFQNENSLGHILDNSGNSYNLKSGDNIAMYIDKKNKLNIQIINHTGTKSALKVLKIDNKYGDEMNLLLRSNNTNIINFLLFIPNLI